MLTSTASGQQFSGCFSESAIVSGFRVPWRTQLESANGELSQSNLTLLQAAIEAGFIATVTPLRIIDTAAICAIDKIEEIGTVNKREQGSAAESERRVRTPA
jgi:hypothetical protein